MNGRGQRIEVYPFSHESTLVFGDVALVIFTYINVFRMQDVGQTIFAQPE